MQSIKTTSAAAIGDDLPVFGSRATGLYRLEHFVSSRLAGLAYAKNRNLDLERHPHVSVLSPWIRHRLVDEVEALTAVLRYESADSAEKFIQELCWRSYWKGWLENRPEVWQRYQSELDQLELSGSGMRRAIERAEIGRTGIECFDHWSQSLQQTGYLHNHARMWFASIWIFTLRLPWQAGADFFMRHLMDADAASNLLSWRWVAGLQTVGKHYLARADNIARFTGGRFNPRGQLCEDAESMAEPHSAQMTLPKFVGTNAAPTVATKDPFIWLIHDEDLAFENWVDFPFEQAIGAILLSSVQHRSRGAVGESARRFNQEALADTELRVKTHFPNLPIKRIDEPMALRHWLEGQRDWADLPLRSAWLPVGPTRDAISSVQGLPAISWWQRPWDRDAWSHARKGFFQFRTHIPDLLQKHLLQNQR